MDIIGPIVLVVICIIIFSICGWCCKKKREGTVYGYGPTVTVTTQPIPQQPYPVHGGIPPGGHPSTSPYPSMPMPQQGYYQPPMGYPPNSGSHYPPAGPVYPPGPAPGVSPYPPTGYPPQPGFQNHPPPYDVAMAMPPVYPPPPQTEAYGKQAAYNPHYQS